MFQLFQLRCFIAVANELHFGKAAAKLNMTQPPLTRQIQLLEEELGVLLLERNRRSVRLTAAGRVFLAEAEFLMRRSDAAKEAAVLAEKGSRGTLVLGFIPAASYDRLPRIVSEVRRHFPDLELVLRELSTKDQLDALEFRRIDLGIVRPTKPPTNIALHRVSREPMVLAVNSEHRFAGAKNAQVSDLEGEPFVMYSPIEGRYFHDMLLAMFQTAGVAPQFVQHVSQDHTVLSLVRAGLGISIVPRSATQLAFPAVEFLEIDLPPTVAAELYAAYRADNQEPVMRRVLELIGQLNFA
jgi:DNA-binding transcriptional LysR family regulator